jgi:hypothetical protein
MLALLGVWVDRCGAGGQHVKSSVVSDRCQYLQYFQYIVKQFFSSDSFDADGISVLLPGGLL